MERFTHRIDGRRSTEPMSNRPGPCGKEEGTAIVSVSAAVALVLTSCIPGDGSDPNDSETAAKNYPSSSTNTPLASVDSVIGQKLASLAVTTLDGDSTIINLDKGTPTAVLVATESDCFSCANLVYEIWELHRFMDQFDGRAIFLVRADSAGSIKHYSKIHHLPIKPRLDGDHSTVARLQSKSHPLLLLIDGRGRIVAAYRRTPVDARRYPLPKLLDDSLLAAH